MKQYIERVVLGHTMRGYEDNRSSTCVVMFHGFTGHKSESHGLFRYIADELASQQISTLRFDWYGHGESDIRFVDVRVEILIEQAKDIIQYALQQYEKVYLLGFSMGGAFALETVIDDIKGLILLAPSVNMKRIADESFTKNGPDTVDLRGFVLHRDFAEGFRKLDYQRVIDRYHQTILIIQGEKDQAVPLKQTKTVHEFLPRSTLKVIANADHCFTTHRYHNQIVDAIVEYLKTTT